MKDLTPNSYSMGLDSHLSPENSNWLTENIDGVNKILEEMRRLAEHEHSEVIDAEGCKRQKLELVENAKRICQMHELLAKRYKQLAEEVSLQIPSPVNMKHSAIIDSGSQRASPLQTPDQKLTRPRSEQDGDFKLYPSSGSGSPDSSLKEVSEYSLSSDSESESFYSTMNKDTVSPMSIKSKVPHIESVEQTELQGSKVMVQKKKGGYEDSDMLSRRLAAGEEELIIASEKIQFLEKENARLEGELKAQQSIQMRDANLEMEKRKVLELQYQLDESQIQIDDSKSYVELLKQELKMYREKLEGSEEELVKLKKEHCEEVSEVTLQLQRKLDSAYKNRALLAAKLKSEQDQVVELEEKIIGYVAGKLQHDREIAALKLELSDAHKNFSGAKEQLESDLSVVSEQNTKLKAIVKDFEVQINSLENEIYGCESEKVEMQAFHDGQVINLQADIENLMAKVKDNGEQVEAMNRNFDMLKRKYDMVMVNNSELDAMVENLNAELSSKNDEIREMNNHLHQLHLENAKVIADSERAKKHSIELEEKAAELQNEVNRKEAVISDRAEEKREAIRQLCFSVEYYRNEYQELYQAHTGPKRRPALAS